MVFEILAAVIELVLGFLILSVLVIWIWVVVKGALWKKMALIGLLIAYVWVIWQAVWELIGWPTKEPMPDGAIILGFYVIEPVEGKKGGIYVWALSNISENDLVQKLYKFERMPRLFRLEYKRELHKRVIELQDRLKKEGGLLLYRRGNKERKGKAGKGYGEDLDDSGFILKKLEEVIPKNEAGNKVN